MNEAQVWTSIGVLGAGLFEIPAVRTEVQRVEDVMTTRFTHLDRDVQAIARKVFGDDAA